MAGSRPDPEMVVLLLDADGPKSAVARAVRRAGHRVVTATGIDTALVVLGTLEPDLMLVRAKEPTHDREVFARLRQAAPQVPARIVAVEGGLAEILAPGGGGGLN